ncbi:dermonecrotic toxin domain-containing protein [Pseudomonas sp. TWP3-1]|uniref:dermonecrotic toxin domain-containing protein n=1 Tax=Pseudomonas sp. TWP3-1 TaxID=2804631 RepID=UPI003CEB4AC5
MPSPTAQSPAITSTPGANALNPASHYEPLVNAIPEWLGKASPTRRAALKNHRPTLSDQLKSAPLTQQAELRSAIASQMTAQNAVDQMLERVRNASAFAEPLLTEALKTRFGLELDVKQTFLQLYLPVTVAGVTTGTRTWTVSLLDAALHNFEAGETAADAYASGSSFITRPSATGQFTTLTPLNTTPGIATFAALCRDMDVGARYKTYLEQSLALSTPVAAAVLRHKVDTAQKAALRTALSMARITGDISDASRRSIEDFLDGKSNVQMSGRPLRCHDLSVLANDHTVAAVALTGIVIFAADPEQARAAVNVVAYVPEDPEHPIKEYSSTAAMEQELIRQLRLKDYQRFFSRFVAHEQRGHFFTQLNQRLSQVKYHPPQAGSQLPPWREAPVEKPNLQFTVTPIGGELWEHLYQRKLNKILNDAAVIAIPTAMVDRNARWARWDAFVKVAAEVIEIASFVVLPFVPFLGEMMMAYIAYQLLDEVFEAVIDWAEDQTTQATEHFFAAVESLIQLGAFGIGTGIAMAELPRVLPAEVVAFIDRFRPVQLRNGKTLYWKPDLKPYARRSVPAADSRPDALGLHAHEGKRLMPIDQTHYAVNEHELPGKLRIEHPTRTEAYQPLVRHNGEGAFHTELEQPLEWDAATALGRIGHRMDAFTPTRRERILRVSGFTEDGLRKMHVNQERVPPLLADSIQRFGIDQDLHNFIQQIGSDDPAIYLRADPLIQLQLLNEQGLWPNTKRLRLSSAQGETLWQSSSNAQLPLTELREDRLTRGDLLNTLLQSLSEDEINSMLEEEFGTMLAIDARTRQLRARLAQLATQRRPALFEQRYQTLQQHNSPLQTKLAEHVPQLPVRITEELLQTATGAELLQIGEGQWPERQQQLSQMAEHELRITRAYEGLELDSLHNADSDTLALHSLPLLPGWSTDVCLVVRDQTFSGTLLDTTGVRGTPIEKVLVRQADHLWQAFDQAGRQLHAPSDFYTSVLQALPDAQRQALNLQIGEGQKLQQLIRDNPLPRGNLRLTLNIAPAPAPVIDTLRLLGAEGYPRHTAGPQLPQPLETRVRGVFPGIAPDGVQAMVQHLQSLPGNPIAALARLRLEYAQLETDLDQWRIREVRVDPATGLALSPARRVAAGRDRDLFARALLSCWRRETAERYGYRMRFIEPVMGDLPVLTADFSHVISLELSGSGISGGIEPFIQRFPRLARLDLQNFDLHALPRSLGTMSTLRQLRLRKCAVVLTPENQSLLTSLNELVELDLKDNPLGTSFNLNFLPSLTYLNLSRTGIGEVPAGLTDHPQIRSAWLADNQIRTLPDGLFDLSPTTGAGYDFSGNPLSAATREQVKTYFTRTGGNLGVRAEQADILRTRALFPNIDDGQASGLIYRLPGSLIQGRLQLTAWESEIATMTAGLARWCKDIPDRDPVSGILLEADERFTEQAARETFAGNLQWLWRHRSTVHPQPRADILTAEMSFIGELPVLSADFSHISALTLTGNKGIRGTAPFLKSFGRIKRLFLRNFELDQLAQTFAGLPMLESLVLDNCGVIFTAESLAALGAMAKLESLELPGNPLGLVPDLLTLSELTYIDLSRTGITETPPGLIGHPKLATAILSDNLITELPEGFYQLSALAGDGYDLSSNPLSAATRERIKTYNRETGQDFAVLADLADIEATQQLFPSLDAQDASDVFYSLPGTLEHGRRQLRHWQAELQQLTTDLAQWVTAGPAIHPTTGVALSPRQQMLMQANRQSFAERIEQLWRFRYPEKPTHRGDGLITEVSFLGELPVLSADFSHLAGVTLDGNLTLTGIDAFLAAFSGVRHLELHEFNLGELPAACERMPALERLVLEYCEVKLTALTQTRLSALMRLKFLNLSHNPLGAAPDLQTLAELTHVRMIDSGISSLPDGLIDLPNLTFASLDHNSISELPDSLFELPATSLKQFNLTDNPLTAQTRERIKSDYPRTRNNFGIAMPLADISRVRALFPALDAADANRVLYLLPGTLDTGRLRITEWEAEWRQLTADLAQWVSDIPAQHPSGSILLSAEEKIAELAARQQFRENLEVLWCARIADRPEFRSNSLSLDLAFIGELPTLSTDFSHVTTLSITGNAQLRAGDGFFNCFSGLKTLELRDLGLQQMPLSFRRMTDLQVLVLSNCAMVLDAEGSATLSLLTRLNKLDLYNNPLGMAPDLRPLAALDFLDLAGTAIAEVPAGLIDHPQLDIVVLSNNRITEIPEELFNLSAEAGNGYDFGNNPLSAATRERVKNYYRKTGTDLGVLAEEADRARVQTLYPTLDNEQASTLIYRLAGTLADGRNEVARQEGALSHLTATLARWASDIPAEVLGEDARLQQEQLREQFSAALLTCWRRIPLEDSMLDGYGFTSTVNFIGELPTLSSNFPYVPDLFLIGNGDSTRIGRFLEAFTDLDSLTIRDFNLGDLPEAIFTIKRLTALSLPECQITLTPTSVAALAGMDKLEALNLSDNPLGLIPDLSNLQRLTDLDLSGTGITEIPKGMLRNQHWNEVDLADNAITEVPEELMDVPASVSESYDLRNNPLSEAGLARIRAYYHETGNDLNVAGIAATQRPPEMRPDLQIED